MSLSTAWMIVTVFQSGAFTERPRVLCFRQQQKEALQKQISPDTYIHMSAQKQIRCETLAGRPC